MIREILAIPEQTPDQVGGWGRASGAGGGVGISKGAFGDEELASGDDSLRLLGAVTDSGIVSPISAFSCVICESMCDLDQSLSRD